MPDETEAKIPTIPTPTPSKREQVLSNYFTYHFSVALPNFVRSRPNHISSTFKAFNIFGLLKYLFAPYRRLTSNTKTTLMDRLSYNLISRFIGASVRLVLIVCGIFATIFVTILDTFAIVFYVIPIFSFPQYVQKKDNTFFDSDLENSERFLLKMRKFEFFKNLFLFFDNDFLELFKIFPNPRDLKIDINQTPALMVSQMANNWPALTKYLAAKNIKAEDFHFLVGYLAYYYQTKPPVKMAPLGQILLYGYTNTLDRFGTDLTSKSFPRVIYKKTTLQRIEKILIRAHANNVLLVGEPGVGKHTTLESLASAIITGELPSLQNRRLIFLDTIALLAAGENLIEVKGNFQAALEEAKRAGNIILAIDNIDRITSTLENRIDLSEVLTTVLTDNSLPVIGISTDDDYNQFIRTSSNLLSLFEKIEVEEPDRTEVITILIGKVLNYFDKDKISATLAAILEIIDKSNRLIFEQKQPEKSIIILEDAIGEARNQKQTYVDVAIVDKIISEKTKTPVGKINESEASKLVDLEKFLHQRIVGQIDAINQISKAMRRSRAEIEQTTKPMGSFLFLGPTGVGKTETAKALAEAYFGAENRMIRLDMSEFEEADAITRLIGDAQSKTQGHLTSLVREHPFGILLLDEFEKAATDVQNLFLQVLDEGFLTDAFGKKVSFKNIIIIATSNAAAEFIREEVAKANQTDLSKKLIDYVLSKGLFSPELLNRFDGVIVYRPLTQVEVVKIAQLMLIRLANELKQSKNITLEIAPALAQMIAEKGFDAAFGARPIHRLIQDKIEDEIAKLIISGKIKNGDTINSASLTQLVS